MQGLSVLFSGITFAVYKLSNCKGLRGFRIEKIDAPYTKNIKFSCMVWYNKKSIVKKLDEGELVQRESLRTQIKEDRVKKTHSGGGTLMIEPQ